MAKDATTLVRSQFGASALDYATSEVHAKGESLARILELAAPQQTWQVLDVATGAGHMAAAFAPHVANVIASDITDEKSKDLIANFNTLTGEDGIAFYPDWPTPTFYDQLNAGLQELVNGSKDPAAVNKELGSEYQDGVDQIVNQ